MIEFISIKALHVLSVIFFMGSLFFLTFILLPVKKRSEVAHFEYFVPKLSKYARKVMYFNVLILLFSGFYLFFRFYSLEGVILWKVFFGTCVVLIFYSGPWILKRFAHISWFHEFFHYFMLAMMTVTVIIAQVS